MGCLRSYALVWLCSLRVLVETGELGPVAPHRRVLRSWPSEHCSEEEQDFHGTLPPIKIVGKLCVSPLLSPDIQGGNTRYPHWQFVPHPYAALRFVPWKFISWPSTIAIVLRDCISVLLRELNDLVCTGATLFGSRNTRHAMLLFPIPLGMRIISMMAMSL